MKEVFLEPSWKLRHTSYIDSFFSNPPDGYKFVAPLSVQNKTWDFLSKFKASFDIQSAFANVLPIQLVKSYLELGKKSPKGCCLTYSLNHCIIRKEPWVLGMTFELPFILTGNERQLKIFKSKIRDLLSSSYCKKILFPFEVQKEAFIYEFGNIFAHKMVVVPRAAFPHVFSKDYFSDRVRILFVNSGNINSDYSFYVKGGAEAVAAFLELQERFDNIELILRTAMPLDYKRRLASNRKIKIIDQPIKWIELENLWRSSDIFLHPHHGTPAHAILDAMSYGLPVITTDTWATNELIQDGKHGFIVHNTLAARFTEGPLLHLTNPKYMREIRCEQKREIIDALVSKLSLLITDSRLRRQLGEAARLEVTQGKYSLAKRNSKLKAALDEVT